MEKLTEFDPSEYLDSEELLKAINDVARARGMTKTVKEASITREGLYKALSPNGNPAFSTVWNILTQSATRSLLRRFQKRCSFCS